MPKRAAAAPASAMSSWNFIDVRRRSPARAAPAAPAALRLRASAAQLPEAVKLASGR
jgi:hypothetical protein